MQLKRCGRARAACAAARIVVEMSQVVDDEWSAKSVDALNDGDIGTLSEQLRSLPPELLQQAKLVWATEDRFAGGRTRTRKRGSGRAA